MKDGPVHKLTKQLSDGWMFIDRLYQIGDIDLEDNQVFPISIVIGCHDYLVETYGHCLKNKIGTNPATPISLKWHKNKKTLWNDDLYLILHTKVAFDIPYLNSIEDEFGIPRTELIERTEDKITHQVFKINRQWTLNAPLLSFVMGVIRSHYDMTRLKIDKFDTPLNLQNFIKFARSGSIPRNSYYLGSEDSCYNSIRKLIHHREALSTPPEKYKDSGLDLGLAHHTSGFYSYQMALRDKSYICISTTRWIANTVEELGE